MLRFRFLSKVRKNLHINLDELLDMHDHFLCKIINEKFYYEYKCFFTGEKCHYDVEYCVKTW